ncbi:MAG: hypothetical protein DRQ55_08535 [Planctomycetota bacterium]|nr:MAG: hypothetical protein DRQ55_08535 [Planctomycetota bacterium]
MLRKILAVAVFALVLGANQASAFCWDNTDELIVKLKRLQLNTEQLKDVFQYQQQHRELITSSHEDGLGCRHHEAMELNFEKASIGVLTDAQFKQLQGRERTEDEILRYDNYLLKKEVARLKKELLALKAELAALQS